jgi:hypothetical protein
MVSNVMELDDTTSRKEDEAQNRVDIPLFHTLST